MVGTTHHNTGVEGVEGGVGVTALMVAAARAIETHRHDTLARDVYAEHFVRAAPASAGWPVRMQQVPDGDANPVGTVRALLRSADEGPRRLSSPVGAHGKRPPSGAARGGVGCAGFPARLASRVRDLRDRQEGVLAFKHEVLDGLSATPKAARVPIPIDLRADWVGALADAGFDTTAPSVWLAEGLLFYLPTVAETNLIDMVDRLSTEGSALAFEVKLDKDLLEYRDSPLYTSTTQQIGIDLLNLFDKEPRPDSAGDLASKGWSTSVHTPFDFTRQHGRGPLPEQNDALAGNRWVFANKPRP